MKKSLIYITSAVLVLGVVVPAFAQENAMTSSSAKPEMVSHTEVIAPTRTPSSARLADRTANLQARAEAEINRRVTSLTDANTRLQGLKHLDDSMKTTLSGQLTSEISTLNALNTKIQGDTDMTTLRTDVQSIVTSYRVYALFLPQIRILAAANSILDANGQFTQISEKFSIRIQQAQAAGTDVTAMQASLTDMNAKIADAQTQAQNAINIVTPLAPTEYPGNKTTLQSARTMIQTARQDLVAARKDALTILQILKEQSPEKSASGSAIPATGNATSSGVRMINGLSPHTAAPGLSQ